MGNERVSTNRHDHPWPRQATHPWVAEGQRSLRMGVAMVGTRPEWEVLFTWVREAERLGFDSFWTSDHPLMLPDCWVTLTAVAMRTTRIRLGTLVDCVSYRHPAIVARMASDVDRVSNGRLILGLGIGDLPNEYAQLGMPYPSVAQRQQALEEAIHIIYGVWDTASTIDGHHYSVRDARIPAPVQQPYVPLLIGGAGERGTLRQVAQYADMSNFGPYDLTGAAATGEQVQHKLAVLRHHCEILGRPYEGVLRSHYVVLLVLAQSAAALSAKVSALPEALLNTFASGLVALTVDEAIDYYRELASAGMQYYIAAMPYQDTETLHLLGHEVLPSLAAVGR